MHSTNHLLIRTPYLSITCFRSWENLQCTVMHNRETVGILIVGDQRSSTACAFTHTHTHTVTYTHTYTHTHARTTTHMHRRIHLIHKPQSIATPFMCSRCDSGSSRTVSSPSFTLEAISDVKRLKSKILPKKIKFFEVREVLFIYHTWMYIKTVIAL